VEAGSRAADEKALFTLIVPLPPAAVYPKDKLLKRRRKLYGFIPAGCVL